MIGCECKQKWCAACNPARGFTEGMPVAEVVTRPAQISPVAVGHTTVISEMRDHTNALPTTSGLSKAIPVPQSLAGNAALLTGWICPLCKRGVSPKVEVCLCSATAR